MTPLDLAMVPSVLAHVRECGNGDPMKSAQWRRTHAVRPSRVFVRRRESE
jgi:hypothetical protein